jgi:4-hydroxy-tetrahydrodipicolinate synthase
VAIPAVLIPLNCSSHNARKTITPSVISDRNMTTRSEDFAGLSVAITTPFRNGDVDYQRLGEQVEFQVAAGTTCIVPTGTTGESPTLSHEEHEQVISAVVDAAAGRAKVMAGTGSNSTAEAIRLTCWAAEAGADAALVVVPYYNKPTQQGMYEHFKAIAAEVEIPLCVYNIPGRTAINLEPQTLERLAELPEITMVKEATGQMDQASQILASTDLTVLSGDDSLTLPLMAMGARGVISVVGNIVPRDMIALIEEFEAGNLEAARGWHHKLFPLCRDLLGLSTNPIPIKAAMKLLDRDTGQLRMPLTELDESELANLRGTLTRYGLL